MNQRPTWYRRIHRRIAGLPKGLKPWRRFGYDDRGVSEIVGEMLLITITVSLASAFLFTIANMPGPTRDVHSDLELTFLAGGGGWGSGDESLRVVHRGGQALFPQDTVVAITVGTTITRIRGHELGGSFSDGKFTIGETWTRTATYSAGQVLTAEVVGLTTTGFALIGHATHAIPATCATDGADPTIQTVTQSPSNVNSSSTGAVTVTVTFTDDCHGVDNTVPPTLFHRLNDGSDPAYTSDGALTFTTTDTWQGSFTETWSSHQGKTLEYYFGGVQDLGGNSGDSTVRQDAVQSPTPTFTYAASKSDNTGTTTNFANVAADDGNLVTITEGSAAANEASQQLHADVVQSAGTWANGNFGFVSDERYATTATNNPQKIRYGMADVSGTPGTISRVIIKAEVSIAGFIDDKFQLEICNNLACSTQSGDVGTGLAFDSTITWEVTDLNPSGGNWTISQINAAQVQVEPIKTGGRDGTWRIDDVFLEVQFSDPTYEMDVDFQFSGVPSGTVYELELEYRVSNVHVQLSIFDGLQFNTRGTTLSATTLTTYALTLTAAEYNGGAPEIRFKDVTTVSPGTQGTIQLDYVRISTT